MNKKSCFVESTLIMEVTSSVLELNCVVWILRSELVEDYIYASDSIPEYASILVPNIDNVCITFLIEAIAKQNKAVLLIGEQGTGKTVMLKGYMQKYDNEVKLFKMINFSSATTPNMFQVNNVL